MRSNEDVERRDPDWNQLRSAITRVSTDSWDWLTVMEGPEVSGRDRIWFGRHEEPWEQIGDETEPVKVCAEPVKHIPLPRPMTRPEIEEWLADGWGERIIRSATEVDDE